MAAPSVCFVSTEIFPGTPGGIGRLIQQSALALEHAGWPSVLLLDVPEAATEKFRVYARSMLPRTSCVTVAELLTGLATDDDIPLWAFHFPEYWRSYRVALALRRLLADTRLAGIEFPGVDIEEPWAVFDATLKGWPAEHDIVSAHLDRPPVIMTPLPGKR